MNWNAFWTLWVCAGIVAELICLVQRSWSNTLTEFMRRTLLDVPHGSAILGAFLVWLAWHWIWDPKNPGWEDGAALLVGVITGLAGWQRRRQEKDEA